MADVQQVGVYSQVDAVEHDAHVLERLRRGEVDDVVLTSSNIAKALARLLDDACLDRMRSGRPRIVSISPVTSAAIRELGWPVGAEAATYTMDGVVQAML